jgi:hypothetical protein
MSWRIGIAILAVIGAAGFSRADSPAAGGAGTEFFEKKIRPVLVEQCFECHSAGAKKLKGAFRLDSAAGMRKGGESGKPAVVPGDVENSLLIRAIRYSDADLQMPPKKALSASVVKDFEQWVRMGAPDPRVDADSAKIGAKPQAADAVKTHWAFLPVRDPPVPVVNDSSGLVRSEIDAFVLEKLRGAGLSPSPRADKRTLIRRAYFDLTGLAPSFEEVESFERDSSPDAFAKVVDRLLASPRYGERWGRHWLDLARYSDTKGYVYGDREDARFVHSHNYRDWVIRALNDDMPYGRFVTLQIAADQAPGARREDLAALGFLTVGRRFLGIIPDIMDDRIDVVTRTTQALTVACARCHDHKFDPIPTQDYYSLYGVFAGSFEKIVPLADPSGTPENKAYLEELKKRQDKLAEVFKKKCEQVAERARKRTTDYLVAVLDLHNQPDELFYENRDGDSIYPAITRQWAQYIFERGKTWDPVWGIWHECARLPEPEFSIRVSELVSSLASSRSDRPVNALIEKAIVEAKPSTMQDVARAYGKALVDASKQTGGDSAVQELREVLFGADSPLLVPPGAIVDLEIFFDEGTRVELSKLQWEIDKWHIDAPGATPQAVVLEDRPKQENPRVFRRGNPMNRGEEVPRRYLSAVSGPQRKPFTQRSGRLELAGCIVDRSNPLTARVMVNRVWAWHFGRGLVATTSDFGLRADPPTHPELLDWLATRFMSEGWSLKKLHRTIMLSGVYQQASAENDAGLMKDPENRLLWRFSSRRLDFESMRDSLLLASGELDLTMGGRPVEIFTQPFAKRRSVYGRVDRQFLPGTFRTFDFASPDLHTPERIDTTVPQQALFMMNSPFVVERARALANRADVLAISDPAKRIEKLYEIVYQRGPTAGQVAEGVEYVSSAAGDPVPEKPKPIVTAWQYGYGEIDPATGKLKSFEKLPHFAGKAWQGGGSWPDPKLGWVQLTADGGHAGNDIQHAAIRRWVAPGNVTVSLTGTIEHKHAEGDGIVARVISSRQGELATWRLHNRKAESKIEPVELKEGDTLDFVVTIDRSLNNNDFLWSPAIKAVDGKGGWDGKKDFAGPPAPPPEPLAGWEKYVQVLLLSNEFVFVD